MKSSYKCNCDKIIFVSTWVLVFLSSVTFYHFLLNFDPKIFGVTNFPHSLPILCHLFQEKDFEIWKLRSSHPEVFLGKGVLKICRKFTGEHPSELRFQQSCKVHWNHTSACMFSCKFAAYFQNIFFIEHLRVVAFENCQINVTHIMH